MWLIVFAPLAIVIERCFAALPKEFHRINRWRIWFAGLPLAIIFGVPYYTFANERAQLWMVLLFGVAFCVMKNEAMLALDGSFRDFAYVHNSKYSRLGRVLTWLVLACDAALLLP